MQLCSLYLVAPVARLPASGGDTGQLESQVRLVRARFLTPRLRVKRFGEMNAWLLDQYEAYAGDHPHPKRTVCQALEAERPSLVRQATRFGRFHTPTAALEKQAQSHRRPSATGRRPPPAQRPSNCRSRASSGPSE